MGWVRGGDIALGKRLAEEEKDKIREQLDGVDLVFLLAALEAESVGVYPGFSQTCQGARSFGNCLHSDAI